MNPPEINLALSSHIPQRGWQGRSNPPDGYLGHSCWDKVNAGDLFSYFTQSISKWVSFRCTARHLRRPAAASMEIKRNEMWCLLWSKKKGSNGTAFGLIPVQEALQKAICLSSPFNTFTYTEVRGFFSSLFFPISTCHHRKPVSSVDSTLSFTYTEYEKVRISLPFFPDWGLFHHREPVVSSEND